jgi:hypothetical protein
MHSAGAAVSDITITLLPSSVEVRQAVLGENGVLSSLRAASTVIDLSGTDGDFPERSGTNGYLFARVVDAEGVQDRDQSYMRRRIILSPQKFVLGSRLTAPIPKLFLKLLQITGSQASAIRMEEFMKRKITTAARSATATKISAKL